MANIGAALKNNVLELWRVYHREIPVIAKSLGLSEKEVEHVIFPNGRGGRVLPIKVTRTRPVTVEKEVDPKELLAKMTTLKPEIDPNPIPQTKREKDPKMVRAGHLAHQTKLRNLAIKEQLRLQNEGLVPVTIQEQKPVRKRIEKQEPEKKLVEQLIGIPQANRDQALDLMIEAMEYITVGMETIQKAMKLLKND